MQHQQNSFLSKHYYKLMNNKILFIKVAANGYAYGTQTICLSFAAFKIRQLD